ncbi:hypothetical protein RRG08_043547 [Elysia crispata]|uniref:Uncharacterized protein n=1 Tax=Elysia crispata TaxID=231223 RepID=A0AAE0YGG2_9GAST|nr:hypothetical protein RRG08_043547 [Elysia crispata]
MCRARTLDLISRQTRDRHSVELGHKKSCYSKLTKDRSTGGLSCRAGGVTQRGWQELVDVHVCVHTSRTEDNYKLHSRPYETLQEAHLQVISYSGSHDTGDREVIMFISSPPGDLNTNTASLIHYTTWEPLVVWSHHPTRIKQLSLQGLAVQQISGDGPGKAKD